MTIAFPIAASSGENDPVGSSTLEGPADGWGSSKRLRVVIADDDAVVLDQVARILGEFDVVARATNGRLLIAAVDATHPDVVVTDLSMPEVNGIQAVRAIVHAHPVVKTVLLSVYDDPQYVEAAFDAGVSAYVLKTDATSELVEAVRKVSGGGTYLSRRLA